MYNILITDDRFGDYSIEEGILSEIGGKLSFLSNDISVFKDADAILVNQYKLNSDRISLMKRCRVISRYGSGFDNVDIKAASKKNILVANVPDYCVDEVAEHSLALILNCIRKVNELNREVHNLNWDIHSSFNIQRLAGKTLGIIGFGRCGKALYKKVQGLGFKDIFIHDHKYEKSSSLEELLAKSDIISIHIPMRENNFHLINSKNINLIKKNSIIINTSRGDIIDMNALLPMLENGYIDAAGLDVLSIEPPEEGSEILEQRNILLTDHCAYYSKESIIELKRKAALNIKNVLLGDLPLYPLNTVEEKVSKG